MIEESRTNLHPYSESFALSYNPSGASITANAGIAPDGTTSAELVTMATNSVINFTYNYTGASAQTYVASVFFKPLSLGNGNFFIYAGNATSTCGRTASFSYSSGAISVTDGLSSLISLNNGWFRLIMPYTASCPITSGNFTISGAAFTPGSTFLIWGRMAEQASFATSYIPTAAAAVTRSADDLYIPVASWFDSNKGSLLGTGISRTAGTGSQLLTAIGTDTLDLIAIRQRSNPDVFFMGREGGTSFDGGGYPGVSLNVLNKIGIAYSDSTLGVLSLNSAAPQNAGTYLGTYGTSYARLTVGSFPNTGGYWNGTIQKVKYYPSRASNTQLQLLTQ